MTNSFYLKHFNIELNRTPAIVDKVNKRYKQYTKIESRCINTLRGLSELAGFTNVQIGIAVEEVAEDLYEHSNAFDIDDKGNMDYGKLIDFYSKAVELTRLKLKGAKI